MSEIKSYKDLIVWRKSILLVKETYKITSCFPKSETYGLVDQMRRAVISVPSNIAEGYGRKTRKDYGQFCSIAYGSLLELETQLEIAKELGFIKSDDIKFEENLIVEVGKMLNALVHKLNPRT